MTPVTLPDTPQTRATLGITPTRARVNLFGLPKVGKTTFAAGWNPGKTLIIDTHAGTALLDGEHYVQHAKDWTAFEQTVDAVIASDRFETVIVDLIDDVYKFADAHAAQKKGMVAAGLIEYGKGTAEAEGLFRQSVGKLLASPLGIWFIGHADDVEVNKVMRLVPKLDKRVRTYIQGACDFNLVAETAGPKRVLRTVPDARYEVGCRVPIQDGMDLNPRVFYQAMHDALGLPKKPTRKQQSEPEAVAA